MTSLKDKLKAEALSEKNAKSPKDEKQKEAKSNKSKK